MSHLAGGFQNPAIESAENFREIMQAMARPGKIVTLQGATPPAELSLAVATTALVLFDHETKIYLDEEFSRAEIHEWLSFHTGAPITSEPKNAHFAIGRWEKLASLDFAIGTSQYPDRSTTLIIEQKELENEGAILRGAGIKDQIKLNVSDVKWSQQNRKHYPCGIDLILCHENRLAALPRHVFVEDQ